MVEVDAVDDFDVAVVACTTFCEDDAALRSREPSGSQLCVVRMVRADREHDFLPACATNSRRR